MEINNGQYNMGRNMNQKGTSSKFVLLFILSSIISVLIGAGSLLLVFHFFPDFARNTVTNVTKTEKEVTVTDNGIADAVEKIYDAVVIVKTYQKNQVYATGTGFVYKNEKNKYYLLTNYHVIQGGDSVKVVFTNGQEEKVTIEGGDKYADIAVLSYESREDLPVADIGDSTKMRVGDTVFAIGAPLDSSVYSWSVTRGILSGKDRQIKVSTDNSYISDWIMQVMQTDAAINSGNSGGPLCNSNGEVVGITNMKLASTGIEGMGFAIPIEEASRYADALISGEDISRPYIGISMIDASNTYAAYQFNITARDGVLISTVEENSPADKAGIEPGDIIIALNGTTIKNTASLRYELYKYKVGDKVKVKFIRNGQEKETSLVLASQEN